MYIRWGRERERERREREVCVSSNVMYDYDDGWGIFGREVKENGYQESRAWAISDNQPIQRFYSFFSFLYFSLYIFLSSLQRLFYSQMLFRFRSASLHCSLSKQLYISFLKKFGSKFDESDN